MEVMSAQRVVVMPKTVQTDIQVVTAIPVAEAADVLVVEAVAAVETSLS